MTTRAMAVKKVRIVPPVERSFELAFPEVEKIGQHGKFRGEVVFLPDERLEQFGVVGQTVENGGRRQPVPIHLFPEILRNRTI